MMLPGPVPLLEKCAIQASDLCQWREGLARPEEGQPCTLIAKDGTETWVFVCNACFSLIRLRRREAPA